MNTNYLNCFFSTRTIFTNYNLFIFYYSDVIIVNWIDMLGCFSFDFRMLQNRVWRLWISSLNQPIYSHIIKVKISDISFVTSSNLVFLEFRKLKIHCFLKFFTFFSIKWVFLCFRSMRLLILHLFIVILRCFCQTEAVLLFSWNRGIIFLQPLYYFYNTTARQSSTADIPSIEMQ